MNNINGNKEIQSALRKKAEQLLTEGSVKMVIGYVLNEAGESAPGFIRDAGEVNQLVWNSNCFNNLATYLSREHVQKHFPAAVVVKGCDLRAVNMLIKEHIVKRDDIILLGLPCNGVGEPLLRKCHYCEVRKPENVDHLMPGELTEIIKTEEDKYAAVEKLEKLSAEGLWDFWKAHFSRCIRCYACRQVCPMCYCKRCIVEKTQPQWVEFSPHLRGNFAWNAIRAFHLTGRCVGCDECERVCPAGIPLGEINRKMTQYIQEQFDYQAGMDPETRSPFTTYDLGIDTDEDIL